MPRKRPPLPSWRIALNKIGEYWKMIAGAVGGAVLVASLAANGAAWYTDSSRSDPPPRASIARVIKLASEMNASVTAALQAVQRQTAQQAVTNASTATAFCELYRPLEADARARVAKDPSDRQAQNDVLHYTPLALQWCGQALAAPPP